MMCILMQRTVSIFFFLTDESRCDGSSYTFSWWNWTSFIRLLLFILFVVECTYSVMCNHFCDCVASCNYFIFVVISLFLSHSATCNSPFHFYNNKCYRDCCTNKGKTKRKKNRLINLFFPFLFFAVKFTNTQKKKKKKIIISLLAFSSSFSCFNSTKCIIISRSSVFIFIFQLQKRSTRYFECVFSFICDRMRGKTSNWTKTNFIVKRLLFFEKERKTKRL